MWVKDRDYIWEQVGAKLVGCQSAQLAQIYDCEPSHVITGNQDAIVTLEQTSLTSISTPVLYEPMGTSVTELLL